MDIVVRPFKPEDRDAVMALGHRLTIGVAPWRDQAKVMAAIEVWLERSTGDDFEGAPLVATADEELVGFLSMEITTHFAGETDAYIGELMVSEEAEGHGVGRALVEAAEAEARDRGHRCLTLSTGAANERAIGFYRSLGFQAEDIKLTKVVSR